MRPLYLAAWGPPLSSLGTPFRQVFFPHTLISIKNDSLKFHVIPKNFPIRKLPFIDLEFLKMLDPLLLFLPVFVNSMFPTFQ